MRARVSADQQQRILAIRRAAAAMSELLAKGSLADEALDRAAQILIDCRKARSEIERAGTCASGGNQHQPLSTVTRGTASQQREP